MLALGSPPTFAPDLFGHTKPGNLIQRRKTANIYVHVKFARALVCQFYCAIHPSTCFWGPVS